MSCSKEDEKSDVVELKREDLWGKWYYSEVILADGTIAPYTNLCTTERDYVTVTTLSKFVTTTFGTDCFDYTRSDCVSFGLTDNTIYGCTAKFDGYVTLTVTKLRIDYDGVKNIGFPDNNFGVAKGIILTKN